MWNSATKAAHKWADFIVLLDRFHGYQLKYRHSTLRYLRDDDQELDWETAHLIKGEYPLQQSRNAANAAPSTNMNDPYKIF